MTLRREDVLYVASLAHLELSEAEVEAFGHQLDAILAYIDKLNQLDLAGVEPMAQVVHEASRPETQLRADVVRCRSDVAEQVLKQAPEAEPPYFRVPKVIER